MKQLVLQHGGPILVDVPAPVAEPGRILVKVDHSCISVGTELAGVRSVSRPLWRRALESPAEVRKVIDRVRTGGLAETRALIDRKLNALLPIGYSAAGVVIDVGAGIERFRAGDRVACAGAGWASHAEYVAVPENLAAPVADGLSFVAASTVTLGAIALQGVRRAAPTLGETFLVIGLGVLGQLTARLLRANGVRVIGVDPKRDRLNKARAAGLDHALDPLTEDVEALAHALTDGHGADGVIITAASSSDDILSTAFRVCRKKGRVVLVGDVGLNIRRDDIYAKELDFLVSTSYGPGRYDRRYEEEGVDYPLAYVRWTESRNMAAYLALLAEGRIAVGDLCEQIFPLERAPEAYAALMSDEGMAPLAAFLRYGEAEGDDAVRLRRMVPVAAQPNAARRDGVIGLGVIGAGGFATATLLPIVARASDRFRLTTVVTRQGVAAASVARQFGAAAAATDANALLRDPETDAVLIATRHDRHASLALAALEAGKHVFVEKPLCLTEAELAAIEAFYCGRTEAPLLMTGFNRRFAPAIAALKVRLAARKNPLVIDYRVNAGYLPPDHWVHGPEGGGRNLGEACHFYDLFGALVGSPMETIQAMAIGKGEPALRPDDNFVAQIRFSDGSLASLTYTALGDRRHPKERMELYCDGVVYELEDYQRLTSSDGKLRWSAARAEKGHCEELEAFHCAAAGRSDWPISLWEQVQATRIAFAVNKALLRGEA